MSFNFTIIKYKINYSNKIFFSFTVLLVLAAAGMVLADRKEKIDLSVSLLLFLAAVNVTSFFSLKDNRIVVVMILTVYFLLYAGAKELLRRRAEKKRK